MPNIIKLMRTENVTEKKKFIYVYYKILLN